MNKRVYQIAIFTLVGLFFLNACVSFMKKEVHIQGMSGQIIPVDSSGNEINYQDRENIIVNLLPLRNGSIAEERSITFNPEADGSFTVNLKPGMYAVEVFLKGFYVESFQITVQEDQIVDLDVIKLEKIETVSGRPIKDETGDEVTLSEGDVNIQPPTQ
jgi:hypothetical protein